MNCAEADAVLPGYCDGELAGVDREQLERHLASCGACASRSRLQARFKAAVRAHLPRPPVPQALRVRLGAVLGAREIAPRRWLWATHPRLVPAAVAALLLIAITGTVRHSQSMVLQQAQRSYQAELPMDIVGSDCRSIASWFRGRVDFPVPPPDGSCQGGRLVNVRERPAAYIMTRGHDGHRVAYLVFDPRDESIEAPDRRFVNGREIYFGSGPGISTAAYHDRGLGYVVTSDLDEDSLTRLVTANFAMSSHQGP
ncbi:MAG TPA: zf-HC2 domain-containing protein [Polyangia bacterium]|nr:zf-HC2 domain-containing protein [Polyangia bacterium]